MRLSGVTKLDQETPMSAQKPEAPPSDKSSPEGAQPNADEKKTTRQTDQSRTGEGSGASGGGSFGNLPGAPVTGGSPEFGPNEKRPQNPAASETKGKRNSDER